MHKLKFEDPVYINPKATARELLMASEWHLKRAILPYNKDRSFHESINAALTKFLKTNNVLGDQYEIVKVDLEGCRVTLKAYFGE